MAEDILTQCTCGGAVWVHVKDGKIMRIRPIVFDETDAPSWTIEAKGKKFSPPRKSTIAWHHVGERSRVYSENRIKYPYKRIDFNPKGKRNPENRGKSSYERISWDEALDVIADEIKRIRETYGPAAITACTSSHHNWGLLFYKQGPLGRFFRILGYTELWDNPDSAEGRHWGSSHAYGNYHLTGGWKGASLQDVLENTDMIVVWSNDPYATSTYIGQEDKIRHLWIRDVGIKRVWIDPFCCFGAGMLADKWIAPRPGTDAALAEAIAYVWLKEGTYDKFFVENRTVGFDEFRKQTLGEKDGTPRTPGWAAEITGVAAHDIVALAREWATKRTMLHAGGSGHREAYSTEMARLQVLLGAMQGPGKPGVNFFGTGVPMDPSFQFPGYNDGWWDMFSIVANKRSRNKVTQKIMRLLLPDVILNPPVRWLGKGWHMPFIEDQFQPYLCPEPGPNGAPIKMVYRHGSSFISTMTDTNKWVRMYQSPNLEFTVNQDCWWGGETRFADIVLPACTNFEHTDISEMGSTGGGFGLRNVPGGGGNHRIIIYQKKCIEPLWESRPDYEIYAALAERLGIKEAYTEGNSEEDWIKKVFNAYSISQYVTYEEFKKKGYFVVPLPKGYDPTAKPRITNRWFYEGRPCDEPGPPPSPRPGCLATYSGKVEFVSQSLLTYFPDDEERPPLPRYIQSWEGYDSELAPKYPLQLITPHVKFSFHVHNDNNTPWLDEVEPHRVIKDGYAWWPVRIHPSDAKPRGINNGDIVKVYNDRGAVLGIALLTERLKPGVIHSYEASQKYDPLEPGKPGSIDRGGCMNLLSPGRMISKNACGMANLSCLVEISKWEV